MTTRTNWISNVGAGLTNTLPRLTPLLANTIAESYLDDVAGGWVPTDVGDPNGEGAPSNSVSEPDAIAAIVTLEVAKLRTISVTIPVDITFTITDNYDSTVTTADIVDGMEATLQEQLDGHLFDTNVAVSAYDWASPITVVRDGGELAASERVDVQTAIGNGNFQDPAAMAVHWARTMYAIGETYMAYQLYSNDEMESVAVWITKYTDTTYTTLDNTFTDGDYTVTRNGFVIFVNTVTGKVQDALVHPLETRTLT